jgi:predicted phosphodiesterase
MFDDLLLRFLMLLFCVVVFAPFGHSQSRPIVIGIIGDQYGAADGTDPYPVLAQAVTVLRESKVSAILHVGDLIEASGVQSETEYKKKFGFATQLLDQSGVPWFLTPGDHDVVPDLDMNDWTREATDHTREGYFLKFYSARKPQLKPKALFYSFDLRGYHFVALYSIETLTADVRWGDAFRAEISANQRQWLEEDLSKHASSNGTIVFTHQPLWYNVGSWARVHEVLRSHHVLAVVAGHFHYSQDEGTTDGIHYLVAGGSGATVGGSGQERSPEAGGQPTVMLMKLRPGRVQFELRELPSGKVLPIFTRHDMDRVQAFSQGLSELYGDISSHTRVCLDRNGQLLAVPRKTAAEPGSAPSKEPAKLSLCAVGNAIDVPAEVSLQPLSQKVSFEDAQFDSKFCETNSAFSCALRPGRRTAVANPSSVSFLSCHQYDYFTNTEVQGGTEMFHATLRASSSDPLKVNDTIPFKVTYRFTGDSNDLWISQTFELPIDGCAE